jgi:rsbT antagonist protein RsbS
MPVPVLKQGIYLIASIQSPLSDGEVLDLQRRLLEMVIQHRSRGVVIDVEAMDIIDTYSARSFELVAQTTRLRGAETVIVGIQPHVAYAMVRFGLTLDDVHTALNLDEGIELLDALLSRTDDNDVR